MKIKVDRKPKGSMIISLTSIVFISLLGISLLFHCITHIRVVKARNTKMKETDVLYQDMIYYLHHFRERIFRERIRDFYQPEIEFFNDTYFPDQSTHNRNVIAISFKFVEFLKTGYKKTRVITALHAHAQVNTSSYPPPHPYHLKAEVTIDILSGKIPLTFFPLLVKKNIDIPTGTFLKENQIINKSRKNLVVDNIETELNFSGFLMDSLKVTETLMNWRAIREKLGLEPSDDPIPEGPHLVVENGVVESVVIQGDVEQMVFFADSQNHLQKIRIIQNSIPYEIHYRPGENYFVCWNHSPAGNVLFREKILVNGDVCSIEQEGDAAFLDNSDIQLFVSGKIIIRSDLKTEIDLQPLDLKNMKCTNMRVTAGKGQIFNQGSARNEIIVDTGTTGKTELQVSMITAGKFTNKNPGAELKLTGSLYCTDLENHGAIGINHLQSSLAKKGSNYFSTVDFKTIDQFLLHFIEEVSDENK
jgi:hypothetical protein